MSNRKIKFRAWMSNGFSEEEFRMYYHDEMGDGILTDAIEEVNENKYGTVLMQNTGLKDKNEVEIYEGDIVDYYIDGYKQTNPLIVDHKNLIIGLNHDDKYYQMEEETLEVIGNIYENKDLIK